LQFLGQPKKKKKKNTVTAWLKADQFATFWNLTILSTFLGYHLKLQTKAKSHLPTVLIKEDLFSWYTFNACDQMP
jgi:hypothetical protein